MTTTPVNLIKGDKISVETDYRDALPVNMYAVERDILGAKGYMLCYPGLTELGIGIGLDRGAVYNERLTNQYRVSGTKLISVDTAGTTAELGTISGSLQAAMPYSFNTQAVIADSKMWLYSPAGGFNEVTDADLGNPIDGVWVDGYYFLTDGEYIYHTDIDDESSIDPLKFATAEYSPDPSLGLGLTQDNKVIVFGRYSTEYFINRATANFAFQRVPTRAQKIGIVATHAKCEVAGNWYITGGYKEDAVSVYILSIGTSTKVSTREVEKILAQYTEPELADMRMESRMEDDISFVLIHLPNETLCFNASIAKSFGKQFAWTILKTDVDGDITYRAINGVFDARSAKWIYGDKQSNLIGQLDNTVFTHYDNMVEWLLYAPFVKLERASIDEIELETIPGHTTLEDAKVAISLTYNGLTYGTEYFMNYGSPSDYGQRFIGRRFGYVSDWVGFKFRGATKSRMSFALFQLTYS
jgi:hypothetical protein